MHPLFEIYLKISKKLKQKCYVYMSMFYVPTKLFSRKAEYLYGLCKNEKIGTKIGLFAMSVFVFFA
jgi:hypothetical protein